MRPFTTGLKIDRVTPRRFYTGDSTHVYWGNTRCECRTCWVCVCVYCTQREVDINSCGDNVYFTWRGYLVYPFSRVSYHGVYFSFWPFCEFLCIHCMYVDINMRSCLSRRMFMSEVQVLWITGVVLTGDMFSVPLVSMITSPNRGTLRPLLLLSDM